MKTILLARHGQASFGSDNYDKLSELGIKQAQILGGYFAKHQRNIDKIFAGTLVRQQDSAVHFINKFMTGSLTENQNIPIQTISQFNEFNHEQVLLKSTNFDSLSEFKASLANEENPHKKLTEMFKNAMLRWHSAEYVNKEGEYDESWLQFATRCNDGLQQVIEQTEDGQTSLVFTSGGVIASIASTMFKPPTDSERSQMAFLINRQIVNTSVTTIAASDHDKNLNSKKGLNSSTCQLLTLNACEHLHLETEEYLTWY